MRNGKHCSSSGWWHPATAAVTNYNAKSPPPTQSEEGSTNYLPDEIRPGLLLLVSVVGNGQLMTTLCPAAGKELATILGGHFATESVLVKTTALGGLKRSFHRSLSFGRAA